MRRSLTQRLHKSLSKTLKPSLTDRFRSPSIPPPRTTLDDLPKPPLNSLPTIKSKVTMPPSRPSDTASQPTPPPTSPKKPKKPTSPSKRKPSKSSPKKKSSHRKPTPKKPSQKTSPKKHPSPNLLPIVHNPDGTLSDFDGNLLSLSEEELSQVWRNNPNSDD